jgi:hypothetical protein
MATKIAKIVKSNSHVDYVARVIDVLDSDSPPADSEYGFAQFVSIPQGDTDIIGVTYNSAIVNPEYGSYGPRLSPAPELGILSPDYLNEQGLLLGILLLGWRDRVTSTAHQVVPRRVVPVNQDVYSLSDSEVLAFHKDAEGRVQLHYYSQVVSHAGAFAATLLEAIIEQLDPACEAEDRQRLRVLKQALVWQRTVGGMRL